MTVAPPRYRSSSSSVRGAPGGIGDHDLYISSRTGTNPWLTPALLSINSAGRDLSPWIDSSGTLMYFDRTTATGGLDLFVTQRPRLVDDFSKPVIVQGTIPIRARPSRIPWLSPSLEVMYFSRTVPRTGPRNLSRNPRAHNHQPINRIFRLSFARAQYCRLRLGLAISSTCTCIVSAQCIHCL